MKKIAITLLLIICTLATCTACRGQSQNGSSDDERDFEFTLLSDKTYGISKLLNTSVTEVAVPSSYKGKPVTRIMSNAFKEAVNMTAVTVPNSVQIIDMGAFSGCSALESITLPFIGPNPSSTDPFGYIFGTAPYSGSKKIEQHITLNGVMQSKNYFIPSKLEKVTVSDGIVRKYAFMSCTMIKEVVFEDGVTEVEGGVFLLCDGLESVYMGKGIKEISDECFNNLTGLKNVVIGKNVTKIGRYAFDSCTALKSIVIPERVRIIENYAFDECTGMESIVFENTSGWYRDYGPVSGTDMDVTDPVMNVKNLTNGREYSSDRWKRR